MCEGVASASGWRGASDEVEGLARRRPFGDPVHELVAEALALRRAVGPGVGLAVDADDVPGALAQLRGTLGGVGSSAPRVTGSLAAVLLLALQLPVDHGAERLEQRLEARGVALERAQDVDERLDGRDVRRPGSLRMRYWLGASGVKA